MRRDDLYSLNLNSSRNQPVSSVEFLHKFSGICKLLGSGDGKNWLFLIITPFSSLGPSHLSFLERFLQVGCLWMAASFRYPL